MADLAEFKELIVNVSANPAEIQFPTDKWGFTSAIRKEVLRTAANVKGQKDKHDLLVATMAVLVAHIQKRLPGDVQRRVDAQAAIAKFAAERAPREQLTGIKTGTVE